MGRKSLKDTQQKKIIKAFYRVAKKEGLENTSFAKIARVLDMPPSLLVHYFSTKEELLLGLVDFIIENYKNIYQPKTKPETNALEQLVSILDNIFSRKWDRLIDDGIFYSCFALVFRNPRIKESFVRLHLLLRQWLAEAIQDGIEQGLLEVEDAAKAADMVYVIADGAYYFLSMVEDADTYREKLSDYRQEAFKILNLVNFADSDAQSAKKYV